MKLTIDKNSPKHILGYKGTYQHKSFILQVFENKTGRIFIDYQSMNLNFESQVVINLSGNPLFLLPLADKIYPLVKQDKFDLAKEIVDKANREHYENEINYAEKELERKRQLYKDYLAKE